MQRRRAVAVVVACVAGATSVVALSPGVAVGKQSAGSPDQRVEVCHEGKTLKFWEMSDRDEYLSHLSHGDGDGACPK
jgi:hypothetical protein